MPVVLSRRAVVVTVLALISVLVVPATSASAAVPTDGYLYGGMYNSFNAQEDLDAFGAWAGRRVTFAGTFHELNERNDSGWSSTVTELEEVWAGKATPFANVFVDGRASAATYEEIRQWAVWVKQWLDKGGERSLIIAPLQEMNGDWIPYGCDPSGYKAAYQRFRQVFRDLGIGETQVRWAFAPNGWSGCHSLADYYPGHDAVDIMAFSSYNYGGKNWDGRYWSPREVFEPWINELRAIHSSKPIIVAQTGTSPDGDKDGWLREMFGYLATAPSVVGFIYFNVDKSSAGGNEWDWRVFDGSGGSSGMRDGMTYRSTAYAWPLRSWFRPGALDFGPVDRAWGEDRVKTAAALSARTFGSADTVVIARSHEVYAHALLAGPLASKLGGPVLLSATDALSHDTAKEIRRLDPSTVILIGSTTDLSAQVDRDVQALGAETRRISGADVFEVGARIAAEVGGDYAYVVEGRNANPDRGWPDAVSISGLASYQRRPILLVERDHLPFATKQAIRDLGISGGRIVGGTVAVSDGVERAIADLGVDLDQRAAGDTRYGTSSAVAKLSISAGMNPRRTWLATGTNYPDALAAGPAVAADRGVLHLVHGAGIEGSPEARTWLRDRRFDRVRIVGGPVAVSPHIEGEALGVAVP